MHPQNCSWTWRSILKLKKKANSHIDYIVGDEKNINLWYDKQHLLRSLVKRFSNRVIYDFRLCHMVKIDGTIGVKAGLGWVQILGSSWRLRGVLPFIQMEMKIWWNGMLHPQENLPPIRLGSFSNLKCRRLSGTISFGLNAISQNTLSFYGWPWEVDYTLKIN